MFSVILLLFLSNFNPVMSEDASFGARLRLFKPITTTVVQSLSFPDAMAGTASSVVVTASSDKAAIVDVSGGANRSIQSYVIENSINATDPNSGESITIDGFTIDGPSSFNANGKAQINIGATAHLLASNEDGEYKGSATLRVIYQ